MLYLVKSYNQENSNGERFGKEKLFTSEEEAIRYIKNHNIYGVVVVYDKTEYEQYQQEDENSLCCNIPEPIEIYDTEMI